MVIVALALGLALGIQAFLIKPYQIPSGSMEPTLHIGQRVLVNRFLYHFSSPKIGDIVVFHPPAGADNGRQCGFPHDPDQACSQPTPQESSQNFIKRIVAGPGDRLSIHNGQAIVNGQNDPAANDHARHNCVGSNTDGCNLPKPITIPPGEYFMMGDNRGSSDDSRFWGPVPQKWFIGKAFATYWPPDRIGFL